MFKNKPKRILNAEKRRKKKHKHNMFLYILMFVIVLFFTFSNNIVVDEKTGTIAIVKSEKIIKEDFEEVYTWAVFKWLPFDIDIDVKDLTWTTIELYFSNNSDFIEYWPYENENLNKIRYWFMLWRVRNRDHVFWLWKNLSSLNNINFNLENVIEWDLLWFKVANLEWPTLFVKLHIKWEKIVKKETN